MNDRERNFNCVCVVYVFIFWAIKYIILYNLYVYVKFLWLVNSHLFQINTINYSYL